MSGISSLFHLSMWIESLVFDPGIGVGEAPIDPPLHSEGNQESSKWGCGSRGSSNRVGEIRQP